MYKNKKIVVVLKLQQNNKKNKKNEVLVFSTKDEGRLVRDLTAVTVYAKDSFVTIQEITYKKKRGLFGVYEDFEAVKILAKIPWENIEYIKLQ